MSVGATFGASLDVFGIVQGATATIIKKIGFSTMVRNGVGDYTFTLDEGISAIELIPMIWNLSAFRIFNGGTTGGARSFRVLVVSDAGAAVDTDFGFALYHISPT